MLVLTITVAAFLAQNEFVLPNGFVWDLSKRLLYYNDTAARKIEAFDCDESGVPVTGSRRTWREFAEGEGQPDVRAQSLCTLPHTAQALESRRTCCHLAMSGFFSHFNAVPL